MPFVNGQWIDRGDFDFGGRFREGYDARMKRGATQDAADAYAAGDPDRAAQLVTPYDPQAAAGYRQEGERAYARNFGDAYTRGDFDEAQRLATGRGDIKAHEAARTGQRTAEWRQQYGQIRKYQAEVRRIASMPEGERGLAMQDLWERAAAEATTPEGKQQVAQLRTMFPGYDADTIGKMENTLRITLRIAAEAHMSDDPQGYIERLTAEQAQQAAAARAELDERRVAVQEGQLGVAERRASAAETTAQAALARAERTGSGEMTPQQIRSGETTLRKEFEDRQSAFSLVRDSYAQISGLKARAGRDAAADLAIIFSFMKMLDPGSVVREQEFANAQNAAGVPDRVRNAYNNALRGTRLNPRQVQDFASQAATIYETRKRQYDRDATQYRSLATGYGFNPDNVVRDLTLPGGATSTGDGTPKPDPLGIR